jgi:hypothetical protein
VVRGEDEQAGPLREPPPPRRVPHPLPLLTAAAASVWNTERTPSVAAAPHSRSSVAAAPHSSSPASLGALMPFLGLPTFPYVDDMYMPLGRTEMSILK